MPRRLRFFGFNSPPKDSSSMFINKDKTLDVIYSAALTCVHHQQSEKLFNVVEKPTLTSSYSSLDWVGATVSSICAANLKRLQQFASGVEIFYCMKQGIEGSQLKKLM